MFVLVAIHFEHAETRNGLSNRSQRATSREGRTDAGARGATMPGVTEDMLARVMDIDFDAMAARSLAVASLLDAADAARLTCPRGSDLTLELAGRGGIADDGDLTAPGAFGNLPC